MDLMLKPKEIDCFNEYKNNTQIYAIYKRPTSDLEHIHTESEGTEKGIPYKRKSNKATIAISF